ncbi:MAG: hypothetical protein K2H84_01850 [Paramuribaculum sp.]|nr:hypothetical protein [Paramuribaculum sp.]
MKYLCLLIIALAFTACISDDISTSPSDLPEFSSDSIALGDIWVDECSPNGALTIYNRNSAGIVISSVAVTGRDADLIRINLDGAPLEHFAPVEIRQNDSVLLLAAAVPQVGGKIDAAVTLTVNSVSLTIPLAANVRQPLVLRDHTVSSSLSLSGEVRVFGTLEVEQGATLDIRPGTVMYMHDKAQLIVNGSLVAEGTPGNPVTFCGDRFGFIAADIPYAILPGQWRGVTVNSAGDNTVSYTSIINSEAGLTIGENASLDLVNCCVANARENLVSLEPGAALTAAGCQFSEAARSVLALSDASASLYRCTIANSYLFAAPSAAAVALSGHSELSVESSILYRPGGELSLSGASVARFSNTLFGSKGSDDDAFISCLWAADPMFLIDLEKYSFDYRLAPDSPARKHSTQASHSYLPLDRFGTPAPDPAPLGAYN